MKWCYRTIISYIAVIGAPILSLDGCGNCLEINITLLEIETIKKVYGKSLSFDIYWKRAGETKVKTTRPILSLSSLPYQIVLFFFLFLMIWNIEDCFMWIITLRSCSFPAPNDPNDSFSLHAGELGGGYGVLCEGVHQDHHQPQHTVLWVEVCLHQQSGAQQRWILSIVSVNVSSQLHRAHIWSWFSLSQSLLL